FDGQGGSTWSPDGRYLAAVTGDDDHPTTVEVIDASTATTSHWVVGGNGYGTGGWVGDHQLLVTPCLPDVDGPDPCAGKPPFVLEPDLLFAYRQAIYEVADPLGQAVDRRLDLAPTAVFRGADTATLSRDSFIEDATGRRFVAFPDRVVQLGGPTWTGLSGDII